MIENFEELREIAVNCRACKLCETRKNVVFGVGNPHAKVMFIGEGRAKTKICRENPL